MSGALSLGSVSDFTYYNGDSTADADKRSPNTAPTNAGTYTVVATFAGNDNYKPSDANAKLVIDKVAVRERTGCREGLRPRRPDAQLLPQWIRQR